jgi:hypothetical protein
MFKNCTSLTTAPALPATKLTYMCYYYMFSGCTSLTTAPELPATTLVIQCYHGIFSGCSKLVSIKVGFTAWQNTITNWVNGVSSAGTFTCPAALPQ